MRNGHVFRYTLQMNLSPFEVSEKITIHIISPYNSESSSTLTSSLLWRHLLVEIRICRIRRGSKQKLFLLSLELSEEKIACSNEIIISDTIIAQQVLSIVKSSLQPTNIMYELLKSTSSAHF